MRPSLTAPRTDPYVRHYRIRLIPRMCGVKSHVGIRVHQPGAWKVFGAEPAESFGGDPARLAAPGERMLRNGAIAGYPCAGINRHTVGNERVLQERSSEPPDLESCGGGREAVVEA